MKLEDIGFYTLSDFRARQASEHSPLWRCELILTGNCNFKCQYCRGLKNDIAGTMPLSEALNVLKIWCENGLKNVRFSGGEPTLYNGLETLVSFCKGYGTKGIALSTNGSADWSLYEKLLKAGVNDFSVSLDSCCAAISDKMMGGVSGTWECVVENIKKLSSVAYTTVGVVINEENLSTCNDTVLFADTLGVADIRVIPSAQYNSLLTVMQKIPKYILDKYPILKYRVEHICNGRNVRGIQPNDSHHCWLALDDMAVASGYHFPCIIYMREHGNPIGKISKDVRKDRAEWMENHDTHSDHICLKNCLDVCIDYNNSVEIIKNQIL